VPSYAELSGPAAADVETYAQAANADARARVKLFRLAFDAAVSSFSGRQQLYERYYSGDPVRLAGALYALYPKDEPVARIHRMLSELEERTKSQ
jgi:4-hydroxyphenylacetate 3-monooxygenase